MDMIQILRAEYEKMIIQIKLLKEIEKKVDLNLIGQFKDSLEDVKSGRVIRVA